MGAIFLHFQRDGPYSKVRIYWKLYKSKQSVCSFKCVLSVELRSVVWSRRVHTNVTFHKSIRKHIRLCLLKEQIGDIGKADMISKPSLSSVMMKTKTEVKRFVSGF